VIGVDAQTSVPPWYSVVILTLYVVSGIKPVNTTVGFGPTLVSVCVDITVVPVASNTSTTYTALVPKFWVKPTVNPSDATAEICMLPGQGINPVTTEANLVSHVSDPSVTE